MFRKQACDKHKIIFIPIVFSKKPLQFSRELLFDEDHAWLVLVRLILHLDAGVRIIRPLETNFAVFRSRPEG